MKKFIIAALGAALGLASLNASAVTSTGIDAPLTPSLTLSGSCSGVVGNTPLASPSFGTASNLSAVVGTVTVTGCATSYKLGADAGSKYGLGSGGSNQRALVGATSAALISYTLDVTGAGAQTDWGTVGMLVPMLPATSGNALSRTGATLITPDVFTITANIAIPAAAAADVYTDSVNVRLDF